MESTIESRSGELLSVPLSRLVASAYNVRKTGGTDVEDLKASIKQGVLQNLIVCPAHDRKGRPTGDYEVVGGQRRLKALQALAKDSEISEEEEILCRVKPTREAAEASLAENVARVAMHPADEFEAFKRLVDEGKSVEDVALRFGTSALTVRRRLKLAGLHPKLIALYRQDGITLEQLMALAVSDDQGEQLSVWESVPEWQSDAATLRRMLVEQEIDVARDPLAKLVGLAAYEAAGGAVRRDLFDEEGAGYLQDEALLQRLASEKLEAAAEAVRAEGWSWVEVAPRLGASELFRFDRCRKTRRPMTKLEAKRHGTLDKRVADLDARLERHFGGEDDLSEEALDATPIGFASWAAGVWLPFSMLGRKLFTDAELELMRTLKGVLDPRMFLTMAGCDRLE
jgi:ParB family chromosome partitioning protein